MSSVAHWELGQATATCWDKRQSWTEVPDHCECLWSLKTQSRLFRNTTKHSLTFPLALLPALKHNPHQECVNVAADAGADLCELDPLGHGEAAALPRAHHPGPGQVGLGAHHDALLARQQRIVSQTGQRVPGQHYIMHNVKSMDNHHHLLSPKLSLSSTAYTRMKQSGLYSSTVVSRLEAKPSMESSWTSVRLSWVRTPLTSTVSNLRTSICKQWLGAHRLDNWNVLSSYAPLLVVVTVLPLFVVVLVHVGVLWAHELVHDGGLAHLPAAEEHHPEAPVCVPGPGPGLAGHSDLHTPR